MPKRDVSALLCHPMSPPQDSCKGALPAALPGTFGCAEPGLRFLLALAVEGLRGQPHGGLPPCRAPSPGGMVCTFPKQGFANLFLF